MFASPHLGQIEDAAVFVWSLSVRRTAVGEGEGGDLLAFLWTSIFPVDISLFVECPPADRRRVCFSP